MRRCYHGMCWTLANFEGGRHQSLIIVGRGAISYVSARFFSFNIIKLLIHANAADFVSGLYHALYVFRGIEGLADNENRERR